MKQNKRIFITGGMGYLGSHLAKEAIKAGHEVCLYDSLIYEQDWQEMWDDIAQRKGLTKFMMGDIRNEELLSRALCEFKPDFVFHFSDFASVYTANHNERLTLENNFKYSHYVLETCESMNIKVIYNSSSSVYGTQKTDKLMKEDDEVPEPTDLYVKYKLMMEDYINSRPNLDIIVFRPATVFGIAPRTRIDLMPNHFTYMAIAKGEIKVFDGGAHRACIDIDELTRAYLKVIERGTWNHKLYNIGHHNMTKLEYAEGVQNVIDCRITDSNDITDPRNLQIDCSRFNDEFDFHPDTLYETSILKVADWIKKNREEMEANNFTSLLTMPYAEWLRMCS